METPKNDQVIAEVREVRDEYAARHDHDVAAIFEDIRAAQEAADRVYVRYVEPLADAIAPVASQLSTVIQQLAVSLGPLNERLRELAEAWGPYLAKWAELAPRLAEWSRTVDALNEVGWLPYHTAPFRHVDECGDDLDLLDRRFSEYYRTRWSEIRDEMNRASKAITSTTKRGIRSAKPFRRMRLDCTGASAASCFRKSRGRSVPVVARSGCSRS